MKKLLLGLLVAIVIIASYLVFNEVSYSPLKENDFQKLFKGYSGSFDKTCTKDFLGLSTHGELYEIFKYSLEDAVIDRNYPKFIEWENNKITNKTIISYWKNCPLDKQSLELYRFTLTATDLSKAKCCSSFYKELSNPKNFYSYIHFDGLEEYFLLYCTDSNELYYLRRRGF